MVCDRDNLEMLLRLSRKKERPAIKERPISTLVPFLALRQGFAQGEGSGAVRALSGWAAQAKLWETEILCARSSHKGAAYRGETLDREIREGRLVWYGAGKERVSFCSPEDLDLVMENAPFAPESPLETLIVKGFFNSPRDFWEIKDELEKLNNINSGRLAEALWREAWHGRLSSDSFEPVRRGLETGFIPQDVEMPQARETAYPFGRTRRLPGALKNRWKSGAPVHGKWFSLVMEERSGADPLEEDALNRDRVRLLLKRWGVLCRPLLENETSVFAWSKLLPAIRRMELAGELITGRFFSNVNSLQFAAPSIAAEMEQAENFNGAYFMNAQDPASLAGLGFEGFEHALCARSAGNRLYYKRDKLIALSAKNGKELQICVDASDPVMAEFVTLLKIPRIRNALPESKVVVEKINGTAAAKSEYASLLKSEKFISDRGRLILW
jgi:ATP-dependent Lhr-like helicase